MDEVRIIASVGLLLALLAGCCFLPGFLCIRHLKLRAGEKLNISIGLSMLLLYTAAEAIYLLGLDWRWCWAITIIILMACVLAWRDVWGFVRRRNIRTQMAGFGILILLGLLFLAVIRHYSGGTWSGDWFEHYERYYFFLKRLPHDTIFLRRYILPARPPMAHLLSAYFLAHLGNAGITFSLFQVIFLFFNILAFFPTVLLAGLLFKGGSRRIGLIMAFFATSPVFIHNSTWTWNKLICAFFVLLSIALYVRGWRKQSPQRIVFAAASMACAILVHYSAGPYAVFLFLHYLFIFPWRKRKLPELIGATSTTAIVLGTWFIWSMAIYGKTATFESNTTVAGLQDTGKQGIVPAMIAVNFYYTLVPHFLRMSDHAFGLIYQQPNAYGYVRDYFFQIFQPNLPFSLGLLGWLACGYLLWRALRSGSMGVRSFWIALLGITTILGVAVSGTALGMLEDSDGLAHVCLQPLTLMGLSLLAGGFTSLPRWLRITTAFSIVATALLGILLHVRMEMIFVPTHRINNAIILPICDGLLNVQAVVNSTSGDRTNTVYLSDHFTSLRWLPFFAAIVLMGGVIGYIALRASRGFRHPRFIASACVSMFAIGSITCLADGILGYRMAALPAVDPSISIAKIEQYIAPQIEGVRTNMESAEAHYRLAVAIYECGHLEDSWNEALKALVLDPYHRKNRYLMKVLEGVYNLKTSDFRMVAVYDQQHMDNVRNQVAHGQLLLSDGFLNKARVTLSDAVRRYPEDAAAHQGLALVLFQSGQLLQAIPEMESAVRISPDTPALADQLRALLNQRGDGPAAVEQRLRELQGKAQP